MRSTVGGLWRQNHAPARAVRTLARDTAVQHGRVTYVQAEEFVEADGQEVRLGWVRRRRRACFS